MSQSVFTLIWAVLQAAEEIILKEEEGDPPPDKYNTVILLPTFYLLYKAFSPRESIPKWLKMAIFFPNLANIFPIRIFEGI